MTLTTNGVNAVMRGQTGTTGGIPPGDVTALFMDLQGQITAGDLGGLDINGQLVYSDGTVRINDGTPTIELRDNAGGAQSTTALAVNPTINGVTRSRFVALSIDPDSGPAYGLLLSAETDAAPYWSVGGTDHVIHHSGLSQGGVGTYCFCVNLSASTIQPGSTIAGSNLRPVSRGDFRGGLLSGTWQCMGIVPANDSTLFLRVA